MESGMLTRLAATSNLFIASESDSNRNKPIYIIKI